MTRTARVFVSVAALMSLAPTALAQPTRPRPPRTTAPTSVPVPVPPRVVLQLDKQQFFLGENILLHFGVRNDGKAPFNVNLGGDYRGTIRPLRFHVTAAAADGKPVPEVPPGMAMGGLSGPQVVRPGATLWCSLPLTHFCRFDEPGVYKLQASHDLGLPKPLAGEIQITLVMPTPEQARQVADEMAAQEKALAGRQDADWIRVVMSGRSPWGPDPANDKPEALYPDFSAMRFPVYLPALKELLKQGSQGAIYGVAAIETPEATEALVELLAGREEQALAAAELLQRRLPLSRPPTTMPAGVDNPEIAQQKLAERAWRPQFAAPLRDFARQLVQIDPAKADNSADAVRKLSLGANLLATVGETDDLSAVMDALGRALERHKQPERNPTNTFGFQNELDALLGTGSALAQRLKLDISPASPTGEALRLYMMVMAPQGAPRPAGWQAAVVQAMSSPIPYIRRLACMMLRDPVPPEVIKPLAALVNDPDQGVQYYACQAAAIAKDPSLKKPLAEAATTIKGFTNADCVSQALRACGGSMESLDIWLKRLDEPEMSGTALRQLGHVVEGFEGSGGFGNVAPEQLPALKERWQKFLADNRDYLKSGNRLKWNDSRLPHELFPPPIELYNKQGLLRR